MAYRINFTVNGSGSTWITNYWDEQASSLTGSVSPIGFSKPSAATLTYKASWTFYLGAPSQIYTLAVTVERWGYANVRLY